MNGVWEIISNKSEVFMSQIYYGGSLTDLNLSSVCLSFNVARYSSFGRLMLQYACKKNPNDMYIMSLMTKFKSGESQNVLFMEGFAE